MIKLNTPYTTTVQYLSGNTVVSATVTDTLYVQSVSIDFSTGALYATIARGTVNDQGMFGQNYPSLEVVVNPDGSFLSNDSTWRGSLGGNAAALIAQLRSTFDQFILASGSVSGTIT